jgi:hypothetical protein
MDGKYGATDTPCKMREESSLGKQVYLTNTLSQNIPNFQQDYSAMAIFNWHIGSYQKGRASSQSDYIWRRDHWSSRDDLVATGCGNLPSWCNDDPRSFFSASDLHERQNGSACRQLVVSLPSELTRPEWVLLVESLISDDIKAKPYQYAIHNHHKNGQEHPHAHILYSDRVPDGVDRPAETFFRRPNSKSPTLGGCKKDSGGQSPKQLRIAVIKRKKRWADLQNQALEAAGHAARVDHRSSGSVPS